MSDVAEVKEALDQYDDGEADTHQVSALAKAARRWVRMVEGLDYEAATLVIDRNTFEIAEGMTCDEIAKQAVDVAVGVHRE